MKEAQKQGFKLAIVPEENAPRKPLQGLDVVPVGRVGEALEAAFKKAPWLARSRVIARRACAPLGLPRQHGAVRLDPQSIGLLTLTVLIALSAICRISN